MIYRCGIGESSEYPGISQCPIILSTQCLVLSASESAFKNSTLVWPLQETSTADADGIYTTPDLSWELRFSTHNAFTLFALTAGDAPLIEGNMAKNQGGGLHLADGGIAYTAEVDFENNRALGDGGGAVYLDVGCKFDAYATNFVNNTSPNGGGGGVQSKGQCAVRLERTVGFNCHSKTAGGFGLFQDSSEVVVVDSTFESNSLKGGFAGEGGAMSIQGVALATISQSSFKDNSVTGNGDSGNEGPAPLSTTTCAFFWWQATIWDDSNFIEIV